MARAARPFPWDLVFEAERLRRCGRSDRAKALLDRALELSGGPGWLYLLRWRLRRLAGMGGALRDVDLAFRRGADAAWIFGAGPLPAGPEARRLRLALRSFWARPESAQARAYLGQALLARGRTAAGLRELSRAARLAPEGWILAWLGEAERKTGGARRALAILDEALRLDPGYANALAWRATARLRLGDAAGAAKDLDRSLKLRPTARAWHDRFQARLRLADLDGALADLEQAVRLNPELAWGPGRPEELKASLAELDRLLRLHPKEARLWAWKGDTLIRLGRPRSALSALDRALRLSPRLARALAWRAQARAALEGATPRAARDLRRCLRLDANCAQGRWLSAEFAFARGDRAASLAELRRAIRLSPYTARLYVARAKLEILRGAKAAAARDLERALSLCPVFPEAERLRDFI